MSKMNRVYIIGPDVADFGSVAIPEYRDTAVVLRNQDWLIDGMHLDANLRQAVKHLVECQAICLLDAWWTSALAHQLQTVAAWMGLMVLSPAGEVLPTSSLRG